MTAFLFSTVAISLSGVMAPGPITAATLASGSRNRHAGALIAIGHALVEVPLVLLLVGGLGKFVEQPAVRAGIGLTGGAFLIWMGTQLLKNLGDCDASVPASVERRPVMTGIVLTGANPYFLVWWATVGLALASEAMRFGAGVLTLFVLAHWMCDLVWLELLSAAGRQGTKIFGDRSRRAVSAVCALVLLGFGLKFLYDASAGPWGLP